MITSAVDISTAFMKMPYTVLNADKGRTKMRDIVSHCNMQLEKFKSQYDDILFTAAFLNTSVAHIIWN